MNKVFFCLLITTNIIAQTPGSGVTDIDGNQYSTVIIGTQEWMAENLRVTKYSNGDPIPNITNNTEWGNLTSGAWAHYNNDSQYENPYGKLYNWYVVSYERNVCPSGWHVPLNDEWSELRDYLGGTSVAGGKMKSIGTQYWTTPNNDATNESGFSGLPGGIRLDYSGFTGKGNLASWWQWNGNVGLGNANYWELSYSNGGVSTSAYFRNIGRSIRCIKDSPSVETIELLPNQKELIKIIDLMGKETEYKPNTVLIYVYSDGTTEKVLQIEP